jgi:hypothetical protein
MSLWVDRILGEFTADLARLWIAADPDGVLLDERVLSGLRARGFELLRFEDSIAFRAEYEERYRTAWNPGTNGGPTALVLHLRASDITNLPWDYLRKARQVSVSLANLFPRLSYTVLRQIGPEHREALFVAQARHATQSLGESATKEFVLTHIFKISPHLIARQEDLWRELLRLHFREEALPPILGDHVARVLSEIPAFQALPLVELFCSRTTLLRVVQDAWYQYLFDRGITGARVGEPPGDELPGGFEIPFEHPDVRVIVDSMFLDGVLHPLAVSGSVSHVPEWAKVGIIPDPLALRNLVEDGLKSIQQSLPTIDGSFKEWLASARKFGEVLARFHRLDSVRAEGLRTAVADVQSLMDERLRQWSDKHYADLPSLPVSKGPVMVHHIPRFLAMRRDAGEDKVALLVFDGLALDQWVQIREAMVKREPKIVCDEGACFAWLPTLTSVSRQAIFSGLKPREFAQTIESTSPEPNHWVRFWQDHGLRQNEILYRKGVKRNDQLDDLGAALSSPALKVAGIVVDTVDEFVHGAVLGKRGIAAQIDSWCETGFVERLFSKLHSNGFSIYLTADHGNVDAVGQGRPKQGVAAETRGERVRTYRSETLAADSAVSCPDSFRLSVAGLPEDFLPLFAGGRTAFMTLGEQAVVHGGIAIEELVVPFIKINTEL